MLGDFKEWYRGCSAKNWPMGQGEVRKRRTMTKHREHRDQSAEATEKAGSGMVKSAREERDDSTCEVPDRWAGAARR
jgi:hypothetical protein